MDVAAAVGPDFMYCPRRGKLGGYGEEVFHLGGFRLAASYQPSAFRKQ